MNGRIFGWMAMTPTRDTESNGPQFLVGVGLHPLVTGDVFLACLRALDFHNTAGYGP
jgi:hypothetical protein